MAAGLTSVPKKRQYNATKKSSYPNKARGGAAYGSEPEFGWQQIKQTGSTATGEVRESGTPHEGGSVSGDEDGENTWSEEKFDGYEVEGMEGGWGGLGGDGFGVGGEERRGRGKGGVEEDDNEWEGLDE